MLTLAGTAAAAPPPPHTDTRNVDRWEARTPLSRHVEHDVRLVAEQQLAVAATHADASLLTRCWQTGAVRWRCAGVMIFARGVGRLRTCRQPIEVHVDRLWVRAIPVDSWSEKCPEKPGFIHAR